MLAEALGDWSSRWFVQDRVGVHHQLVDAAARSSDHWEPINGHVFLSLPPEGSKSIGLAALGRRRHTVHLTEQDRLIVADMTQQALSDLKSCLGGLCEDLPGSPTASPGLDCLFWQLRWQDGAAIGRLALSPGLMVHLRKRTVPAADGMNLGSIEEALANQKVCCEALLGRCDVSLSEAETLAVGDVLVLEGRAGDEVAIRISGADVPLSGLLRQVGETAIITIKHKKERAP